MSNNSLSLYDLRQGLLRASHGLVTRLKREEDVPDPIHGLGELVRATEKESSPCRHDDEVPVFLLATGWRTGSTMMQRLLMTDTSLCMWGEPHGRMGILSRISDMVASFDRAIAPDSVILKSRSIQLSGEWIANLYPHTSTLRQSIQSMVYEWLAVPARELGFQRWGMKEVRLGYGDAAVLSWLFPRARFVVITRDPFDAYRSALQLGPLWERWPDRLVRDAYAYGQIWNRLAISWSHAPKEFPARVFRLEEMSDTSPAVCGLSDFCSLNLNPSLALSKKVGAGRAGIALNGIERWLIGSATRSGRQWLGY